MAGGGGDDPGAGTVGEVGKAPVQQHAQLVAEADEKQQMHPQPSEPGDEPLHFDSRDLGHGVGPPNRGHGSLVPIAERFSRWPVFHPGHDFPGDICAHLHGRRGNPRNQLFFLPLHPGVVADGKHRRMSGQAEVGQNFHPPLRIGGDAQLGQQGIGPHARGPDDVGRVDGALVGFDEVMGDGFHNGIEAHLDSHLLQRFSRVFRQGRIHGGKEPGAAFQKNDPRLGGVDPAEIPAQDMAA